MFLGCLIAAILVKLTDLVPPNTESSEINDKCGAEYCPEEIYLYNSTINLPTLSSGTSQILVSIWLGLAALGLGISCAFLDSRMKEPQSVNEKHSIQNILQSVKAAFLDPKLQLAAPLTLFIGLEQGFIYADFIEVSMIYLNFSFLLCLRYCLKVVTEHRYFIIVIYIKYIYTLYYDTWWIFNCFSTGIRSLRPGRS